MKKHNAILTGILALFLGLLFLPSTAFADAGGFNLAGKAGFGYMDARGEGIAGELEVDLGWRWRYFGINFEQSAIFRLTNETERGNDQGISGISTFDLRVIGGIGSSEFDLIIGGGFMYGHDATLDGKGTTGVVKIGAEYLYAPFNNRLQIGFYFNLYFMPGMDNSDDYGYFSVFDDDIHFISTGGIVFRFPFV